MATIHKGKPQGKKTKTKNTQLEKFFITPDEAIREIYDKFVAAGGLAEHALMIVAMYQNGLSGNVQAQKFYLSNVLPLLFSEQAHLKVSHDDTIGGLGDETKQQVVNSIMGLIKCADDPEDSIHPQESANRSEHPNVTKARVAATADVDGITRTHTTPASVTRERTRSQGRGTSTGVTETGPTSVANKPATTAEHYRQKPGVVAGRTTKE